jgi:glycosyltransferase involved in cell wall biosynthesis
VENNKFIETDRAYQYKFTVFTPTYNRANTLDRVYGSLKSQTYRDFEWLIVDDASTDNTHELVEKWQQENLMPIRYIYQEHGHKHIAYGRGVKEANGELFLTFDSDDSCEPQALERFKYHWDQIPEDRKKNFSAVTCLCKDVNGEVVGDLFPFNPTDSDSLEIQYRFKVKGDKWGFHRTDVLRQISYHEEFAGIHIPESIYWHKIARKYKTRFVNEAIYTYWYDQVQTSILRNSHHPRTIAVGARIYYLGVLNKEMSWFRFAPFTFWRSALLYVRYSLHLDINIGEQFEKIETRSGRLLWLSAFPGGYLLYLKENYFN